MQVRSVLVVYVGTARRRIHLASIHLRPPSSNSQDGRRYHHSNAAQHMLETMKSVGARTCYAVPKRYMGSNLSSCHHTSPNTLYQNTGHISECRALEWAYSTEE